MVDDTPKFPPKRLTVEEARTMRAEQSRLAELHASRVARLRAARRYPEAAQANSEYRRCARLCRLLGEHIRGDQPLPSAARKAA
jgi:hypothetical protein